MDDGWLDAGGVNNCGWWMRVMFHLPRIRSISIPTCKSFEATLTGPALKWLGSLKPGSINNFSTLVNKFYEKFEGSRSLEKQTSDLYGIVQGPKESVRDYYNRFNKEMISIKKLDTKTAIECFRKGLIL